MCLKTKGTPKREAPVDGRRELDIMPGLDVSLLSYFDSSPSQPQKDNNECHFGPKLFCVCLLVLRLL
jgi:hypothetical protein